MADLNGMWLGTYWQNGEPTRFEMTVVQADNSLSGNILDDGPLGEASLAGTVIGRSVSFTKRYQTTPASLEYTGTLSEEGDFIQGDWRLNPKHHGRWEARRQQDDLMAQLRSRLAQQVPAGVR